MFNLGYMYMLIGNYMFVIGGTCFSLIGSIISVYLIASRVRKRLLAAKDKRLNFFKNVIRNLRYIKMRAWENFYAYRVYYLREKEMYFLKIIAFLNGFLYFFEWYIVVAPQILIYIIQAFFRKDAWTFSEISTYLKISMSSFELVMTIPAMIGGLIDLYVSASRIDRFLEEEEIDQSWIEEFETEEL